MPTAGSAQSSVAGTPLSPSAQSLIGSQATFYDVTRDEVIGSANQDQPWPALSLIKLYMADYVLQHGSVEDGYLALEMVATSDDGIANRLDQEYPEAVEEVAEEYGLESTVAGQYWGVSRTSTFDVVSFLAQVQERDPHGPIITAMSLSTPEAADGYEQDFGTHVLPGAYGSKWGWSNDRTLHSSVTIGDGWIAAAAVGGGPDRLSAYATSQFEELARQAYERSEED